MAALVVIDILAQAYDGEAMLQAPLGGTQSAVADACVALADRFDTELFNAVPTERRCGGLRVRPHRQITFAELERAQWIVFVSWATPAGLSRLPLRRDGPRVALWAHHDADQNAVQFLRDPALRSHFSRYLFVSEWQRDRYITAFGIDAARCAVVGNPYCARAFAELEAASKRFDTPRLIYTSTPFRGLDVLAKAFPRFRIRYPGATLKVFSGMELYNQADLNAHYAALFARLRSMAGVTLAKPCGKLELYRELQAANLFAFPSTFQETFCIAALEARLLGNPLLLTRLGALPEVFGDAMFFDGDASADKAARRWTDFMAEAWNAARSFEVQATLRQQAEQVAREFAPSAVATRIGAALELQEGGESLTSRAPARLPCFVSLTTLPSRVAHLRPTLESLCNQNQPPDRIFLCLPRWSVRENRACDRPAWLGEFTPLVQVIDCADDHGPAAKLLGCLDWLPEEPSCLVIVDDDMVYRPFLLECLYRRQVADPRSSFSFWTYPYMGIEVGQGADGFSFYSPNLRGIREFATKALASAALRLQDDLWVSAFLYGRGVRVRSIRHELPDAGAVYDCVHRVNQLRDLAGAQARSEVLAEGARHLLELGLIEPMETS